MHRVQVLVLEDEESLRSLWVEALESAGYAAIGLSTGTEALERLPDLRPDLILLDIVMPDMSGINFLARLRTTSTSRQIPVLIISALGDTFLETIDGQVAEFPTLGVVRILSKPIRVQTMIEHVRQIIGPGALSDRRPQDPS